MPELTDEHVLCAYVDGSDLHDIAPLLRLRLQTFIGDRRWTTDEEWFDDVEALVECLAGLHTESETILTLVKS
jgi:hypothetical protein